MLQYTVSQYTVYSITVYSVTVYHVTVYTVTAYDAQWDFVQCAVYSTNYTISSVHCPLYGLASLLMYSGHATVRNTVKINVQRT